MNFYTGYQWLLIDAANQFGHDKLLFEERIQWATDNLSQLESLADQADTQPLYRKAVMAIRKAQQGIPTGHMVGVDATCSGIQIMAALTACVAGAEATGMVNPNKRADAYTETTDLMKQELGEMAAVARKDAKQAVMTCMYGSKAVPLKLFGKDTPELDAFYTAITKLAPGPWSLLQVLLNSWNAYALTHEWKLPDGYDAKVKVMEMQEAKIEVDELDHATFTYQYYENKGLKTGLSNVANVTHSMDAYVLREMHRRCNYDKGAIELTKDAIRNELMTRYSNGTHIIDNEYLTSKVAYYINQYTRSTLASAVVLPYITHDTVKCFTTQHLEALNSIVNGMLQYMPFPLVTIHDEFRSHANNVNWVRYNYKEILADIAESNVLDDLLTQLYKEPSTFEKLSFNLPAQIRNSNYALT